MKHLSIFVTLWIVFLLPTREGTSIERAPPLSTPKGQTIAREKPKLLLYYTPWCPYSQRVLDYLKQIHRTIPLKNIQQDPKSKEDLRKIGGKTQVPCLIIDGNPMYESATIIQWLSQNRQALDPN